MHVLLTGATGLVGQYLLRDLLQQGKQVAVLIRSQEKKSAPERLEDILTFWEKETGKPLPRPACLEGDISREGLGLPRDQRQWVKSHCDSILHNGANLTFIGKERDKEPWLSNYTGTKHVLDFCRQTGVRQLHYISTAYVCGKRSGLVLEDELDLGQEFRNDYEQSKFEAEKLVRGADFLDRLTVYRPAVITGDSQTGFTSTYHGIYSYIQFIWLAVRLLDKDPDGRVRYPMRLNLTGQEGRNLVTVDWVSAVTAHIFLHPEHHGRTYHLTPLKPLSAYELHQGFADYFNFYDTQFIGKGELDPDTMNDYEKTFYGYVSRYQDYWAEEPTFDCRHTKAAAGHLPCIDIDPPCLRRLIEFAVHDRFGKRREPRAEKPQTVQT